MFDQTTKLDGVTFDYTHLCTKNWNAEPFKDIEGNLSDEGKKEQAKRKVTVLYDLTGLSFADYLKHFGRSQTTIPKMYYNNFLQHITDEEIVKIHNTGVLKVIVVDMLSQRKTRQKMSDIERTAANIAKRRANGEDVSGLIANFRTMLDEAEKQLGENK